MKSNLILTLTILAILSNSCKKDKCDKVECDLEGTYKVEVKVIKQIPFFFYSETPPDFNHLNRDGFVFYDTNQNVCCKTYNYDDPKFGPMLKDFKYKCPLPTVYALSGVNIFKSNNDFFLKSYISPNNQIYSNLPFTISSNSANFKMPYEVANNFEKDLTTLSSNIGVTSDINWSNVVALKFVELNLEKIDNGVYKGNWVFIQAPIGSCEINLSNGTRECSMNCVILCFLILLQSKCLIHFERYSNQTFVHAIWY